MKNAPHEEQVTSEDETRAILKDHPEILERFARYKEGDFEGRPLDEVMEEAMSQTETKEVVKDHPEILERVERYKREGSKGRPLRKIMEELSILPF